MVLPEPFERRMQSALGTEYPAFREAMDAPPRRSLRVNTLKIRPDALAALLPVPLTPNGIVPEGFLAPADFQPGRSPLHAAGLFYMQEASAEFPATLLHARPGDRVLDLCASPGGKSGQIAAMLANTGLLVANEVVPARATTLLYTLERLGVRNAAVTNANPETLCRALPAYFDAVLVDAPCSGEGMFRKEPEAVAAWSPEHVRACAVRQRAILETAARAVRPGGTLVYSTCTFSPEENEETVRAFLAARPDYTLMEEKRFYPHNSLGEGQYAARLVQTGTPVPVREPAPKSASCAPFLAFCRENLTFSPAAPVRVLPDGRVFLLPEFYPGALDRIHVLRAGTLAGECRGDRFLPDHALFLAYPADAFSNTLELSPDARAVFLAGETSPCDPGLSGWCAVTAGGYPVGFGKAVLGTLKNHLPKGLRIR